MEHTPRRPDFQPDLELDHLRYLRERSYRREMHAALRRISRRRGEVVHWRVLHEHDYSCCQRFEPWPVTALRIQRALADDGERTLWVLA